MKLYFSDYFEVDTADLDEYGAFNVSLINDLPVFIDPFLLFNSDKAEYQKLHQGIIKYLRFLSERAQEGKISKGLVKQWFLFPEVKQNWLGFSKVGNGGSGLGPRFARALNENLASIFANFGHEQITQSSHLEKLCLVKDGVGKDNISDFTTNLIMKHLCQYTETFATRYLDESQTKKVGVPHVEFNYETRRWASGTFTLPYIDDDYVLLTPKDILTKDDAWINKNDVAGDFAEIVSAIPDDELRAQINEYFLRVIPDQADKKEYKEAINKTLRKYPELIDRFIKLKEDMGHKATALSEQKVEEAEALFIEQVGDLICELKNTSPFYDSTDDTYQEALNRVMFLKQVIENNDGYRLFYLKGEPIKREADLQLIFRLTWYAAKEDVNAEVNNGRGPVDYKISRGSKDSTLVEFKLASNSKIKQNLAKQVEVYEAANQTKKSIKVILFFSDAELERVVKIMNELKLKEGKDLVLIDARSTNKPSGSNAK